MRVDSDGRWERSGRLCRGNVKLALLLLLALVAAGTALLLATRSSPRTRDVERIRAALVAYERDPLGPDWRRMRHMERAIRWLAEDRVEVSAEASIAGRPWQRRYRLTRRDGRWEVTGSSSVHGDLGMRPRP